MLVAPLVAVIVAETVASEDAAVGEGSPLGDSPSEVEGAGAGDSWNLADGPTVGETAAAGGCAAAGEDPNVGEATAAGDGAAVDEVDLAGVEVGVGGVEVCLWQISSLSNEELKYKNTIVIC